MGFNQAIKDMKASGERFGVFHSNVKVKHFTGDGTIAFRILPAFSYVQDQAGNLVPASPVAFEPFRRPDNHEFTEWGNTILLSRGIGHGKDYKSGTRKDILSPKTFDPTAMCPLTALYNAAAAYPEWQYLIEDQKTPDGKTVVQRAALGRPNKLLVMNVVDVADPQTSGIVQVGCFTKSSYDSLFGNNGLAVAPAAYCPPEVIARNFCAQWAYGDITDPNYGPVLLCVKGKGQGQFSKYSITMAVDSQGRVKQWPLNEAYLQQRYDMARLDTIVARETEQEIIGKLCNLLNMRSPTGRHEWHLLKEVFGGITNFGPIPENAPAASPTIQSGFSPPSGPGGFAPPSGPGGFSPPPAYGPLNGMPQGGPPGYPGGTGPVTYGPAPVAPPAGQIQYGPAPIAPQGPGGGYQPAAVQPPAQGPGPVQPPYVPTAPAQQMPASPPPPMAPQQQYVQQPQQPQQGAWAPPAPPQQAQQAPDDIPMSWPQQQPQQRAAGPVTAAAVGPAVAAANAAPQQPIHAPQMAPTAPPQQPQQGADPATGQPMVPGTGMDRNTFLANLRQQRPQQ